MVRNLIAGFLDITWWLVLQGLDEIMSSTLSWLDWCMVAENCHSKNQDFEFVINFILVCIFFQFLFLN